MRKHLFELVLATDLQGAGSPSKAKNRWHRSRSISDSLNINLEKRNEDEPPRDRESICYRNPDIIYKKLLQPIYSPPPQENPQEDSS